MKYRVLIEQDEDGVFVAEVPTLPSCLSQGATRAKALENSKTQQADIWKVSKRMANLSHLKIKSNC